MVMWRVWSDSNPDPFIFIDLDLDSKGSKFSDPDPDYPDLTGLGSLMGLKQSLFDCQN